MAYFTVTWISTGYTGAPGYTKLKFILPPGTNATTADANAAAANSRVLLAGAATGYPSSLVYTCQTSAQSFDDAGVLTAETAITSVPTNVLGSGGTNYPGGVGAVIYWLTGALNGGHKVRGRTYFVPFATTAFASDGSLATTLLNNMSTAANTYIGGSPSPAVNTRKLDQADRGNATYAITAASVKDRTAFLRTRRV